MSKASNWQHNLARWVRMIGGPTEAAPVLQRHRSWIYDQVHGRKPEPDYLTRLGIWTLSLKEVDWRLTAPIEAEPEAKLPIAELE